MTNDKRKKQLDLYNNSIEANSMRDIELTRKNVEDVIMERRRVYAEDYSVLIQALINTMVMEFNTMFPGAEAFIEGRIKSKNSIALKLKNKFQKAIDEQNSEDRTKAIEKVDLTDILGCSIVVTVPPKRFRTTNDKFNERLNDLAKGFETSGDRLKEHNKYIEDNEEQVAQLNDDITALKQKRISISKNGITQKMLSIFEDYPLTDESARNELYKKLAILEMQEIQEETNAKNAQKTLAEENIKYGQQNLNRTQETYDKELLELQREMAYYFVSNLETCQSFKILNTKQTEIPERKNKPGFVATCAKYISTFTDNKTGVEYQIAFEIQGKGEEDWKIAEFGKGASYHEDQKSDEGQYSKQTYLPDFTIIGRNITQEIEEDVKNQYRKLDFKELMEKSKSDLEQWINENSNLDTNLIISELERLKKYSKKIQDKQEKPIIVTVDKEKKVIEKDTDEYEKYRDILERVTESKMNDAYETAKQHIIQSKIEKQIDSKIDKKADEPIFIKCVEDKKNPLNSIYHREIEKIQSCNEEKTEEEIKHEARIRVLYYIKEEEIREIAKDIVPIYFFANISDNKAENSMVYYRSTGEAIYRYYYNRLHGLKKGDGYEENFEPQEQQKIALLKLTGLFEEDENNFFIYDKNKKTRIDINEIMKKDQEDELER